MKITYFYIWLLHTFSFFLLIKNNACSYFVYFSFLNADKWKEKKIEIPANNFCKWCSFTSVSSIRFSSTQVILLLNLIKEQRTKGKPLKQQRNIIIFHKCRLSMKCTFFTVSHSHCCLFECQISIPSSLFSFININININIIIINFSYFKLFLT